MGGSHRKTAIKAKGWSDGPGERSPGIDLAQAPHMHPIALADLSLSSDRAPPREAKNTTPSPGGERATLAGAQVLVVDVDPPSVKLMSVLLTAEGFDVRAAASAEEAQVVLRSLRPRLLILDLLLPLMSGLTFARQLKQDPQTRDLIILAVTAFNGPHAERLALEAGCAGYVRKPIDALTFPQLVWSHLQGPA
jgi:CheY-like chemotaxis protein